MPRKTNKTIKTKKPIKRKKTTKKKRASKGKLEYPLAGFSFQVDFLFSNADKNKYVGPEESKFMEVSGIKASLDFTKEGANSNDSSCNESFREIGESMNALQLPTGRSFSNLVLKRGLTYSNKLISWFESSLHNLTIEPIPLLVSILSDIGDKKDRFKPIYSWLFYEVYPISWEFAGFDAMKSQYIMETIELRYSHFIVLKTKGAKKLSSVGALEGKKVTK